MSIFGSAFGGVVGGATVKLLLDKSQFDAGLAQARGQTEAGATTMGKFSGAAKAAFAVAGIAAAKFAGDSLKAFMESEAVMSQFQNTLSMMPQLAGETTAAFQEQATALQNLTGYQDEEIISADNILARFKLTGEQIRQAIPIVLDYARATGTEVPAAAQNIGKALLGNTRALKSVGIEFTATGNTAKDFNDILGLMQGKVGGAAGAFGDTLAGKMDIAKAKLDDFKEDVGQFVGSQLLLLTGDLHGAASAWVQVADATDEANDALYQIALTAGLDGSAIGHLTAAQSAARTEMQHSAGAANEEAAAHRSAAAAMHEQAQAARDLRDTENALAGGLLGVLSAGQQVSQDQAVLNKLRDEGKTHTAAYNDAVRQGIGDYLALKAAVAEYNSTASGASHANELVKATLSNAAHQMGATQGSISGLMNSFGNLRGSVGSANAELARTSALINSIPTHKDVYIVTHYSTVGTPGTAGGPQ